MIEFIIRVVILLILRYPGAGVRWLFSRIWKSKKKFSDFLNDTVHLNAIAVLIPVAAIILIIKMINLI